MAEAAIGARWLLGGCNLIRRPGLELHQLARGYEDDRGLGLGEVV